MQTVAERILAIAKTFPLLTAREISKKMFGEKGYQQQVNPDCCRLCGAGKLRRTGAGGVRDPYRYEAPTI